MDSTKLVARDQVEFTIALGQLLYLDDQFTFDDRYSAAAEQFEVALGGADLLDTDSRDRLFDWWALSLDRQAQLGPEGERRPAYQRIVDRAEREMARDVAAASASYWLAAGARGVNDLPRAWGAAVAAWVRAASLGDARRGAARRPGSTGDAGHSAGAGAADGRRRRPEADARVTRNAVEGIERAVEVERARI